MPGKFNVGNILHKELLLLLPLECTHKGFIFVGFVDDCGHGDDDDGSGIKVST